MPFVMENFIKYDNYGVIDLLSTDHFTDDCIVG